MSSYHPIFDDCTDIHCKKLHYKLDLVFVQDGWRYATNGYIAVREQCPGKDTKASNPPFFTMAALFVGKFNKTAMAIPTNKPRAKVVILTRDYAMSGKHLALIAKHGGVLYLPHRGKKYELCFRPAKFTIGETIEGRVMPIKEPVDAPEPPTIKSPP